MTANLLSRLQGLTAPDREVDAAIGLAIGGWTLSDEGPYGTINVPDEGSYPNHPGSLYPSFTESLDAAVALCERVLPGYEWTVDKSGGRGFAGVGQSFNEEAATPAIALLIAILTALEAREK